MTSEARLFANGRVIGERFRLVRALGEGGMGVVWEAVEEHTGSKHALKFIREDERTPLTEQRLVREAQAASAIRHPNIVRIDEVAADDDGTPVMIMELLRGESLGACLEREGTLSIGQATAIIRRVVDALRAAHAVGIVHRDLKPDNIFLVMEPDGSVDVRVLDFGIAKQFTMSGDSLTMTGSIVGTPHYMSPEQAGGERGLDARTDVWSIAVILFECLTGTTPATGDNFGQLLTRLIRNELTPLAQLRPDLPPDLVAAVNAALVPRDRRSPDLGAMDATLARYADRDLALLRVVMSCVPQLPAAPPSVHRGETMGMTSWRNMTGRAATAPTKSRAPLIALAAVLLLAVAGGAGSYVVQARGQKQPTGQAHVASQPSAFPGASVGSAAPSVATPATVASSVRDVSSATAVASSATTAGPKRGPVGAPSAAATPSATSSSKQPASPTRLQGGVAGDVPF